MLKQIFSVTNYGGHKVFTVFGIKFKFRLKGSKPQETLQSPTPTMTSQLEDKKYILNFVPCEDIFPENFYNDFITNDLSERYVKLMRGLDNESKKLLNRVLHRILNYAKYKQTKYFVESEEYDKIITLLHPDIVACASLGNGFNAINGYCISGEIGCGAAVICKHFIDEVNDKNKILNADIIDAGAYTGDSALVLSDFTNGKIHAFEPEISNYEHLKRTIKINNLDGKVVPVKMGLGCENVLKTLTNPPNGSIGASFCNDLSDTNHDSEDVYITSIDYYVKENNIKVGLIKTDVEGFEQDLLKGAIETIKRDKPVLMISIYHTFDDFWNIKPLIESWNLGYTFKIRKPYTLDFCGDMVLIAETPAKWISNDWSKLYGCI